MSYSGLCVGGPLDGQRMDATAVRIQIEERPATPLSFTPVDEPLNLTVTTTFYHWWDRGNGLWLLDGVEPAAAMTTMAEKIGFAALASRYEQIVARQKDDDR